MPKKPESGLLLIIAYLGFISLGLPDAVAGVAWPSLRETFELRQSGLGAILASLGAGYLISSFLTGKLTSFLGIDRLLVLSSGLVCTSLIGYGTAAYWPVFLLSAFLTGIGSGAIDAGLNTYAAEKFSVKHVNWLHACYSLGAMAGPILMTTLLVNQVGWRWAYLGIAGLLLIMTVLFFFTRHLWRLGEAPTDGNEHPQTSSLGQTLRIPLVWWLMLTFLLYTGLEITIGQWSFTLFTELRGVDVDTAGLWTSSYYGCILAGRVLLGGIVGRIGEKRMLGISMAGSVAGALLFVLMPNALLSFVGLLLVGLSLAPIFPTLISQTPALVGREHASHSIGFQVSAAMLGIIIGPSLLGVLGVRFGLDTGSLVIMILSILMTVAYLLVRVFSSTAGVKKAGSIV
jgi:fucose permease